MRFSISVWVRQAYCFKVPEFVQTWVAPSTDIAFRLKIHMNSIKMSSRILVTGKNMQEAIEPQDPCLKNRWETLTMYINVFLSWSKMAAVSPIIHCLIATRVFRSVYCTTTSTSVVAFFAITIFGYKTLLLMPRQRTNKNNNNRNMLCKKVQSLNFHLSPHESKFFSVREQVNKTKYLRFWDPPQNSSRHSRHILWIQSRSLMVNLNETQNSNFLRHWISERKTTRF